MKTYLRNWLKRLMREAVRDELACVLARSPRKMEHRRYDG